MTPDDEIEARRRETLRQVLAARVGVDAAQVLMERLRLPAEISAIESLICSTPAGASQPKPAKSSWDDMAPLDRLAAAHHNAAMSAARLASKKGDR